MLVALLIYSSLAKASASGGEGAYHFVREITIGGTGSWDDLTVDAAARRLYVAFGTKAVVIDIDKNAVVGEVADTPGIHGIAIASDLKRGFTSNGRENKVSIFDLDTLKTVAKVETGGNPDTIIYEPIKQEVYAFNVREKSATVFEAKTGKVLATIQLSGKPESAVSDPAVERVYCNIENKNEIAVIDAKTHQVVESWPIAPGKGATGMAFDAAHHRLFIGCDNQKMEMIDSTNGKVVASVPIGDDVDANEFDRATQMAFSSNGEGTLTIAHEDAPNKLTLVQNLKTKKGARTMALDPSSHNVYLPVVVDDNFKIMVYGK